MKLLSFHHLPEDAPPPARPLRVLPGDFINPVTIGLVAGGAIAIGLLSAVRKDMDKRLRDQMRLLEEVDRRRV